MKEESQQSRKNQVRTSIKIILLVVVVGLVYLGIRVPIPHPVVVKSLFQEGETAVRVAPVAAMVHTNVGGTVRYVGTKTSAPIVAPENPYLNK